MVKPQAAVVVLNHLPDDDEIERLAAQHLDAFPAEEAHARCMISHEAPEFLDTGERDQVGAYLRDGAACVLVIYMSEGYCEDDDDYYDDDDEDVDDD